jgi:threonine synthase
MEKFCCSHCGKVYSIEPNRWRCDCGFFLDLVFEPKFPIKKIVKRPAGLWRYREALPILRDENIVSMGEGFTPLEEMMFHGHPVLMKIDYLFPTGSYKDRGATVLISKAKELDVRKVVEDSSGNAGAAIAAYSVRAGIGCEIYVPGTTSPGKLAQIEAYGATLVRIEGSRERTAQVTMEAALNTYYASHCWNPFFLHGTKTFAFEVSEQMGWRAPDVLVLPVGHGTLFLGAHLGFKELKEAGMVRKIPEMVAIQSASCPPLYKAFKRGKTEAQPVGKSVRLETEKETKAEGIAIANPVRGKQILEVTRETRGEVLTVTEKEIVEAQQEMGKRGYFVEPTSAATVAGLKKYLKHVRKGVIVSTLTGMGLKTAGET